MSQRKIIIVLCLSFFLSSFGIAQATSVVNITPASSVALSAGQSVTYSIQLSSPIICPVETSTACVVEINLVSSDSRNLTLAPTQLTWLPSNWYQIETFTATANSNLTLRSDETATVVGTLTSASTFYSGDTFTISQALKATVQLPHCKRPR